MPIELTDLTEAALIPETGSFRAWKKCRGHVLVELEIPADARRSSGIGREGRAEFVKVLQIEGADVAVSWWQNLTEYRVGDIVRCPHWGKVPGQTYGIYFWLTRSEAQEYWQ
jgi:Family of unknown function (DUF5758)